MAVDRRNVWEGRLYSLYIYTLLSVNCWFFTTITTTTTSNNNNMWHGMNNIKINRNSVI